MKIENQDPSFFEKVLIKLLLIDENVRNKVVPFLNEKIFGSFERQQIIKCMLNHQKKFETLPSIKELKVIVDTKSVHEELEDIVVLDITEYRTEFLIDQIEAFLRQKITFNNLIEGVELLQEGKIEEINNISDNLRTSVSFSFDVDIGFNLFSSKARDEMYKFLNGEEETEFIPTGIDHFDKDLKGGVHRGSSTIFIAESGMGKSLVKCAVAANICLQNYKVLYITLELSEKYMGERILQNVLDTAQDDLRKLTKEQFGVYYDKMSNKLNGLLRLKKYTAGMFNANGLRYFLGELKTKENFVPDVIMVDYLGLFEAMGVNKNSNSNDKGIAKMQELNAIADDYNVALISSAQCNRSGYGATQFDPTNLADSIGIFQEAYVVVGVTQTEEQRLLLPPVYSWFLMKNRFNLNKSILTVGIDYTKMKLINLDNTKKDEDVVNEKVSIAVDTIKKEEKKQKKNKISIDWD